MKRIVLLLLGVLCMVGNGISVQALEVIKPEIIITKVSPGSANNSREEFIELKNISDRLIDFGKEKWSLQIASSGAINWKTPIRTIQLTGYMYPGVQYVIGTSFSQTSEGQTTANRYPEAADTFFAPALSAGAGHIRLLGDDEGNNTIHDEVEWVAKPEASIEQRQAFIVPKGLVAGSSLVRREMDDNFIDTNNDAVDFEVQSNVTPSSTTIDQPALPIEEPVIDTGTENDPQTSMQPIAINEILPNPSAPSNDTTDEYIELYNPNEIDIDISGYILRTGLTTFRKYSIPAGTNIASGGYLVLYSSQTKLSLSNTGSQVSLFKPGETEAIDRTEPYTAAGDGLTWQLSDNSWQWSSTQTPGKPNELTLPLLPVSKTSATTANAKPKAPALKKAAPKAKATKQTKPKSAKTTKKATKTIKTTMVAETKPKQAAIHSAVLAAVLAIALLYGAYEYRHELYRQFKRFGRNRTDRSADRFETARPGANSVSE